jgi:hypothetical protein
MAVRKNDEGETVKRGLIGLGADHQAHINLKLEQRRQEIQKRRYERKGSNMSNNSCNSTLSRVLRSRGSGSSRRGT